MTASGPMYISCCSLLYGLSHLGVHIANVRPQIGAEVVSTGGCGAQKVLP